MKFQGYFPLLDLFKDLAVNSLHPQIWQAPVTRTVLEHPQERFTINLVFNTNTIRQEWESKVTYGKSFMNMENSKTFIHVHRNNLVMVFSYKEEQVLESKIKSG